MNCVRIPILFVIAVMATGNLGCQSAKTAAPGGWLRSPTADLAQSSDALQEDIPSDPVLQRIGLIQARASLHESDNNTAEAVRSYESILKARQLESLQKVRFGFGVVSKLSVQNCQSMQGHDMPWVAGEHGPGNAPLRSRCGIGPSLL